MANAAVLAVCAAAYLTLHAAGVGAAWGLRGPALWMTYARWVCGVWYVGALAVLKLAVLLRGLYDANPVAWAAVFAVTALWECSNGALIFGGAALQEAHGIATLGQLGAAWAVPAQVNVLQGKHSDEELGLVGAQGASAAAARHHHAPTWRRLAIRSAHVAAYLSCGFLFRFALQKLCGATDDAALPPIVRTVLELEAVVVLGACFIQALNVLPLIAQAMALAVARGPRSGYQVIFPYGSFYFVTATRAFWARWSRPAGQVIRRMFFTPLQGRQLCPSWVLVPFVFLLNAQSHFLITIVVRRPAPGADAHAKASFYLTLLGYWALAYGVLAAAAVLESVLDPFIARRCAAADECGPEPAPLPTWYRVVRGAAAHAALRVAAYAVVYGVFDLNMHRFL
eukprot:TRINITY_DN1510_c0_g1_i1.p1 TRINITY_DN1510_c0_g1~~TRINITY_DN1510_c0_g1_i1.p1  ORF type:complete len:422 (+),score=107.13 TRINITY_DN1510_c0_g1_i1:77-1267(+)